jgi:DNA repair protein RAD50
MFQTSGDLKSRYSIKKSDLKRKQDTFNSLLSSVKVEFESILNKTLDIQMISHDVESFMNQRILLAKNCQDKYRSSVAQTSSFDAKLQVVLQNLSKKQAEYQEKLAQINKAGCQDFNQDLIESQQLVDKFKDELSSFDNIDKIYKKFLGKFHQNKCCPLCTRSFDDQSNQQGFEQKLILLLEKLPERLKETKDFLAKAEEKLRALNALKPVWDDCERLSKYEIIELRDLRNKYENERNLSNEQVLQVLYRFYFLGRV